MDNTKDVLKGAGRRRNRENVEEMCKKCRPSEPEVNMSIYPKEVKLKVKLKEAEGHEVLFLTTRRRVSKNVRPDDLEK